jgi:GT2 family glycosyltransferase/glycosyltransferase involved in cell wall biosynthesis
MRGENEAGRVVDVIVPVYGGMQQTRRCLNSLRAALCRVAHEIVVIDDASPDEALTGWLAGEAGAGRITFLHNASNLGFAATVNRGMALHPERDVVLLNSDTEVAGDWLDRLLACAGTENDIGTVTPFSNNATICSYPFEGWRGEVPGTLGLVELDALFAKANAGESIELPTAVGFCMLIRRACLEAVGEFDVERFRRGYGEENDFCMRARALGWRHVLATDVFVYHKGGVSFGATRHAAMAQAAKALAATHPGYQREVEEFIRRDPPAPIRARIDQARARMGGAEFAAVMDEQREARIMGRPLAPRPVVLHVLHDWGGGIERWVKDYAAADLACRNLTLHGVMTRNHTAVELVLGDPLSGDVLMRWPLATPIDGTAIDHPEYAGIVSQICAMFEVRALWVSSLIGHALELLRLELPVVLVTHDLYPFCPALFASFGQPCALCDAGDLARCFAGNTGNAFWHVADATRWQRFRAAFEARLEVSKVHIVVPSVSLRERYVALFPTLGKLPWTRIPHGLGANFCTGVAKKIANGAAAAPGGRLRVVIPGRLSPHKGLWLFQQLHEELRTFADVLLLGCGVFGAPFAGLSGVEVVPDYDIDGLPTRIAAWRPDCALLLSVLPESFGYTLSEMRALGVPTVATRSGAYQERIAEGKNGFLVEAEAGAVVAKLRTLDQNRALLHTVAVALRETPVRTAGAMVADYSRLLPPWPENEPRTRAVNSLLDTLAQGVALARETVHLREQVEAQGVKVLADIRRRAEDQRQLEVLVQSLAAQHAAILRSTSWRMSAPVRALGRLRNRLRAALGYEAAGSVQAEVYRVKVDQGRVGARSRFRFSPEEEAAATSCPRSRAAARDWLHEIIHKPDAAVVIAGGGVAATQETLRSFTRVANEVVQRSTRAVFVWCGTRDDELVAEDERVLRLLQEVRALILLRPDWAPEVMAGADVLLLQADAAEGREAVVPVLELAAGAGTEGSAVVTQLLQYCGVGPGSAVQ